MWCPKDGPVQVPYQAKWLSFFWKVFGFPPFSSHPSLLGFLGCGMFLGILKIVWTLEREVATCLPALTEPACVHHQSATSMQTEVEWSGSSKAQTLASWIGFRLSSSCGLPLLDCGTASQILPQHVLHIRGCALQRGRGQVDAPPTSHKGGVPTPAALWAPFPVPPLQDLRLLERRRVISRKPEKSELQE